MTLASTSVEAHSVSLLWYRACLPRALGKRIHETLSASFREQIMAESKKNFEKRVYEATGVELSNIPAGEPDDILGGQILCRRGVTYVVTCGYPDYQDEDGLDIWEPRPENFWVVTLDGGVKLPDWVDDYFDEITIESEASEDDAFAKMEELIEGEECVDNYRYALIGDENGMAEYKSALDNGCCGSYDALITFGDGKKAIVGCNFGH